MKNKKQYWMCIIGGVKKKNLPMGADSILRNPVRNTFNVHFGNDEVCASGWGINEERYNLLRTLHEKSNEELQKLLEISKLL